MLTALTHYKRCSKIIRAQPCSTCVGVLRYGPFVPLLCYAEPC
jgi:hypothetical protein